MSPTKPSKKTVEATEPQNKWWVAKSGKHRGPYTSTKVAAEIVSGNIKGGTLICALGGEEWIRAEDAEEFRSDFESATAPGKPAPAETANSFVNPATKIRLPEIPSATEDSLKAAFRYLLIGEIVFFALSLILSIAGEVVFVDLYPSVERSDFVGFIGMMFFAVLFVFILPALILSWVGLFGFKNWARWLYLSLFVIAQLLYLPLAVLDYSPSWGLAVLTADLGTACSGAILVLAFLTPLSYRFKATVNEEPNIGEHS